MTRCASLRERFTQTDPLEGQGSAYVYANDNPAVFVDPSGMRGVISGGYNILANGGRPIPRPTPSLNSGADGCGGCDFTPSTSAVADSDHEVWNSVSPGTGDRALHARWNIQARGAGIYSGRRFASFTLQHYLGNSGQDVFADMSRVVATGGVWSGLVDGLRDLSVADPNLAMVVSGARQATGDYESDWVSVVGKNQGAGSNMHLALGTFSAKTMRRKSSTGKWCTAVYVADRYNFNPALSQSGIINDKDGSRLAQVGLARPYNFTALVGFQ